MMAEKALTAEKNYGTCEKKISGGTKHRPSGRVVSGKRNHEKM